MSKATDKQSETTQFPIVLQPKKKFVLMGQDEKIVATLIDKTMAEKWVADHKKGAVRFVEDVLVPVI